MAVALLLAAALFVGAGAAEGHTPVVDTDVAKIGDTGYATLADAVGAAQNGDTITLLKNVDNGTGIIVPAKGGAAVVTVSEACVDYAHGKSHGRLINLTNPGVLAGLTNAARAIKRHGAIANIELTARWEIALREIEDGARQGADFEERIRRFTERLTKEILSGGGLDRIRKRVEASIEKLVLKCPKCGHEVRNGEKSIWCNDKDGGCGFVLWKDVIAGKKLGDETWKTLVKKGETGVLTGFRSKAGKEFTARLRLDSTDKQGRVILEPEWKNSQSHGGGIKKS